MPTMAWVVLVLGVLWIAVRIWASRAESRRAAAREERMAELLAEREALLAQEEAAAPSSLGAVVSDSNPPPAKPDKAQTDETKPAEDTAGDTQEPKERVKVRCRACRALNDEDATVCASCGKEI